jgi:sugar phosphate isomerase/epimerase
MKPSFHTTLIALVLAAAGCVSMPPQPQQKTTQAPQAPAWSLAVQAWTFRSLTFFDTVDKLAELGIRQLEAYPGQKLVAGEDLAFSHTMDAAACDRVRAKLKEAGVKLVSYGVVSGKDEAEWAAICKFARDMGIQTVCCEPADAQLSAVDRLAGEFGVNAAFHNHPQPSHYWNPETVLAACKDRSSRLGACADTGHWVRSGLDPVECLHKLQGRIITLHMKDLDVRGAEARDVPWGTGASGMNAMLAELARQGFCGVITIEYEHDDEGLARAVGQCAYYLRNWHGDRKMTTSVEDVWKGAMTGEDGVWSDEFLDKEGVRSSRPSAPKTDQKGTVTACGEGFSGEGPANAFDKTPAKWCINQQAVWIQYQYAGGAKQRVTAYAITSANDEPGRDPRKWRLLGSNDGKTWTELDAREGQDFPSRYQKRSFDVKNPGEYNIYKLDISENHGDVSSQVSEIELLEKK